jgi:integrase
LGVFFIRYDCPPDALTQEQLEGYFESLVKTHSWSTVKIDRNGLQFFFKHILKREWCWVDIVKPPQVKTLADVMTLKEIERLINATRELRYQTFILVSFSMGCDWVKPSRCASATSTANA